MHDENYNSKDPRCIKYKSFIKKLERRRVNFKTKKNSKFYSKEIEVNRAVDEVYRYIRQTAGYAPAWLFNELDARKSGAGRPTIYTHDDRLFNSVFVDQMTQRGSSVTQSIKLLALLTGHKSVSEGFMREVRETYNEYKKDGWDQGYQDIAEFGWVIAQMLELDLFEEPKSTEIAFEKATLAFRRFWQDVLDLMKQFRGIVREHDESYSNAYDELFPWLDEVQSDPIECFFTCSLNTKENLTLRKDSLVSYIDSIGFFRDEFKEGDITVEPFGDIDTSYIFSTVEKT